MLKKNTNDLLKELECCESFKKFQKENSSHIKVDALSSYFEAIIKEKDLKKSEIIKASGVNEIYAYQILSGIRTPERKKVLALAIAMGLELDRIQSLLKSTGYAQLYIKSPFDCAVMYGICNGLSVIEINTLLFENNLEILE